MYRQALDLHPSLYFNSSYLLQNFANALQTRFIQGGQQNDLDDSISFYKQALELVPSPHYQQSVYLYSIGKVLILAHSTKDNDSEYLDQAMSSFLAATQCISQSAYDCFQIAKTWIHHADIRHKHS